MNELHTRYKFFQRIARVLLSPAFQRFFEFLTKPFFVERIRLQDPDCFSSSSWCSKGLMGCFVLFWKKFPTLFDNNLCLGNLATMSPGGKTRRVGDDLFVLRYFRQLASQAPHLPLASASCPTTPTKVRNISYSVVIIRNLCVSWEVLGFVSTCLEETSRSTWKENEEVLGVRVLCGMP